MLHLHFDIKIHHCYSQNNIKRDQAPFLLVNSWIPIILAMKSTKNRPTTPALWPQLVPLRHGSAAAARGSSAPALSWAACRGAHETGPWLESLGAAGRKPGQYQWMDQTPKIVKLFTSKSLGFMDVHLSICLSVCLPTCLSIYLSIYLNNPKDCQIPLFWRFRHNTMGVNHQRYRCCLGFRVSGKYSRSTLPGEYHLYVS